MRNDDIDPVHPNPPVGVVFGRLTVIRDAIALYRPRWSLQCVCGEPLTWDADEVSAGVIDSCANCARRAKPKPLHPLSRHALNATDAVGLYEGILGAQGGACAICRADTPRVDRSLFCLDHDHDSGRVRGLLCVKCNVGLGTFQDDPKVLQAAIDYLKEHGK